MSQRQYPAPALTRVAVEIHRDHDAEGRPTTEIIMRLHYPLGADAPASFTCKVDTATALVLASGLEHAVHMVAPPAPVVMQVEPIGSPW